MFFRIVSVDKRTSYTPRSANIMDSNVTSDTYHIEYNVYNDKGVLQIKGQATGLSGREVKAVFDKTPLELIKSALTREKLTINHKTIKEENNG